MSAMRIALKITGGLFLVVHSITDLRERQVWLKILAVQLLVGILFIIAAGVLSDRLSPDERMVRGWFSAPVSLSDSGEFSWVSTLTDSRKWLAFLPGLIVALVSVCTREALGMGDALVLLISGFFFSAEELIYGICLSLPPMWLYLWMIRKRKEEEIPYIPFLTLGMIGGQILGW